MPAFSPPRHWFGVVLLASSQLAGGEPSFGDELAPRSTQAVQSAGCRRCCHTSTGDGLPSGELGECEQAFKGKPGMCVRGIGLLGDGEGDDALCCPSITAHFLEGDVASGDPGTCSFEPFTPCIRDTGGSCKYFSCSTLREATQCVGDRCLCQPGFCSVDGICVNDCALNNRPRTGGANSVPHTEHAPGATCGWKATFLDRFGWKDWACESIINNYGRSECIDGFCHPRVNLSKGEDSCWLGDATNGSIELFANKCERDTGRAAPFIGCSHSIPFLYGCPVKSNASCESGRCMCGENQCSIAGVCTDITPTHEALPILPVESSLFWSPWFFVVLTVTCLCCCCIVSQGDTLTLVTRQGDPKVDVKIDMSTWEVIISDLSESIVDVTLEREAPTDDIDNVVVITHSRRNGESATVRVQCKKVVNESKWAQVINMENSFLLHGKV